MKARLGAAGRGVLALAAAAVLTLASGMALAQAGGGRRSPDANRQLGRMTQRLRFDADQQKQLLPVLEARDQQMMELRSKVRSGQLDRAAARTQMRAIHQDTTQKIDAVLTPVQRKEYEQYQAVRLERWKTRHQSRGGGTGMGPGGGMGSGLGGPPNTSP